MAFIVKTGVSKTLVTHITRTCANDGVDAFSHCIKGFERFNVDGETRLKLQCEQEALVMFFFKPAEC